MDNREKTINDLEAHRLIVRELSLAIATELFERAHTHDKSKYETIEFEAFNKYSDELSKSVFGSKEYNEAKQKLGKALEHHYKNNRHHPEHFENQINDMNLVDIIEMFLDWIASSVRSKKGNINESIEVGKKKYNIGDQLINIFVNTLEIKSVKRIYNEIQSE